MALLRVYLDTSVFGGCFDKEFEEDSRRVLRAVQEGRLTAVIGARVLQEIREAPAEVRNILDAIPEGFVERIDLREDVFDLQRAYLAAGILTAKSESDLLHVAAATVFRVDAIVSWNFRHIVRLDKIKAYNLINFEKGYGLLTIVSPKEVNLDAPEEE